MENKFHNYEKHLTNLLNRIEKSSISDSNKNTIKKFNSWVIQNGLTKPRQLRLVQQLFFMSEFLSKNLSDIPLTVKGKPDVEQIIERVREKETWSERTKYDMLVFVRQFFKWRNGDEEYPKCVSWFHPKLRQRHHKMPEELLTQDEVKQVIENGCDSPQQKFFCSLLWETGRIEFLEGFDKLFEPPPPLFFPTRFFWR